MVEGPSYFWNYSYSRWEITLGKTDYNQAACLSLEWTYSARKHSLEEYFCLSEIKPPVYVVFIVRRGSGCSLTLSRNRSARKECECDPKEPRRWLTSAKCWALEGLRGQLQSEPPYPNHISVQSKWEWRRLCHMVYYWYLQISAYVILSSGQENLPLFPFHFLSPFTLPSRSS